MQNSLQRLNTKWLGQESAYYLETVGSTNRWLAGKKGMLPHGAVVLANHQSAGKGRQARPWVTPPDTAVALSILLKPNWPANQTGWLMMMLGVAAIRAIKTVVPALAPRLKWPNDVVFMDEDGLRKVGGILVEGEMLDGQLHTAVLGIGLNANIPKSALPEGIVPTTSLLVENEGRPVERTSLVQELLYQFEQLYDDQASPLAAWRALLVNMGQHVVATSLDGGQITGTAVGADEWGRLLIQPAEPTKPVQAIAAGDVTLRPPSCA